MDSISNNGFMNDDEFLARLDLPATVGLMADSCGAERSEIEELLRRGVLRSGGTLRAWIRAYVTRLRDSAEDATGRSLR